MDHALDMFANDLQYAYGSELGAKVIKSPDANRIAKLQGYSSAKEMKTARP